MFRSFKTRLTIAMYIGDAQHAQDEAVQAAASRPQFLFCDDYSFGSLNIVSLSLTISISAINYLPQLSLIVFQLL